MASYPGFGGGGGAGGGTRNIDMSRSRRLSYKLEVEADRKSRTETDLAINIRKATSVGELEFMGRRPLNGADKCDTCRGDSSEAYVLLKGPPGTRLTMAQANMFAAALSIRGTTSPPCHSGLV